MTNQFSHKFIRELVLIISLFLSYEVVADDYDYDLVIPLNPENFGDSTEQLDGPTGKVIGAIINASKREISSRYASPSHGYNAFFKGKYACVTPDSSIYHDPKKNFIDSLPIHDTIWVSVYRKDGPAIKTKTDLMGKTVGLIYREDTMGAVIPPKGAIYDFFGDLDINLKKLVRGRIDALVVPVLGLNTALSKDPSYQKLTYDADIPLAIIPDRVMCHDTKRGREIIAIVNRAIPQITNKPKGGS